MTQFRFDREAHAYYLGAERIPGLTSVLAQVIDFSFVRDEVLARKSAIGSALHLAVELDYLGELDESSLDPAVLPYFDGWRKFKDEQRAHRVTAAEEPIYSPTYRYGCTPDIWGATGAGDWFVTEIKSTTTIHPAVALQTAAQRQALAESLPDKVAATWFLKARRFALQLRPNGSYKLHEFTQRDDFAQFLALLSTYRWKQRNNLNR